MWLGAHTFRPGDVCVLAAHDAKTNEPRDTWQGVVARVNDTHITVTLDERAQDASDTDAALPALVRVVKLAQEATYDRLASTLASLARLVGVAPPPSSDVPTELAPAPELVQVLLGLAPPRWARDAPAWSPLSDRLNDSQRDAISLALRAEHYALIHGPPGTGKTTAVAELIVQLAVMNPDAQILVCGASNLAVDNLLERVLMTPAYRDALAQAKAGVTRIGHPARVLPALTGATLDVQSAQSDEGKLLRDVARELDELMAVLHPPSGAARAGNKSARKAPRPKGAERRQMWEQVRELRKEYRRRDRALSSTVLQRARIVMATCHGAGGRVLSDRRFDVVIIDEACQALEMSCWTPLLRLAPGGRVVLSGDHLQLPPTVMASAPALPARAPSVLPPPPSLETTLFDRLLALHGDRGKALLSVQYRMNDEIMAFPNAALYESRLSSAPGCAGIRLADLGGEGDDDDVSGAPLVLYDTSDMGMYEREDDAALPGSHSRINENEAAIVLRHLTLLRERGIAPHHVAVLSPYAAQVSLLAAQLRAAFGPDVEVGTVDGMQGRERDVVVVSLVRSNDAKEVGFLEDRRRLNVAMTRARRQLVIVGDAATVGARGESAARRFLQAWMAHLHDEALVDVSET